MILVLLMLFAGSAQAQSETPDSVRTQELDELVVEEKLQSTSANVSTYIPTTKQKNASQSASDLLNRMAIPQLSLGIGGSVQTASGKSVDVFIDYLPATQQDMSGMRVADVRKVEYYDYPDDPRFLGKAHVVNFIMQKYEYGGYVKAYAREFFIANSGQLDLYSKLQYKKMTYNLVLGGYYNNASHTYNNTVETYRLPQADGLIKQFERYSITKDAESRRRYFWPTFKAQYSTDNIYISNSVGANFDNYPKDNTTGIVYFSPADFPQSDFINETTHSQNYITYNGYWNFTLPHGNVINFAPYYSYSRSRQSSRYAESESQEYINAASDHSHEANGNLQFQHDFGKWGDLTASVLAIYTNSRTKYTGTASNTERLTTLRVCPGIAYSYSSESFYGRIALGCTYDYTKLAEIKEENAEPYADVSLQYAFNDRNSVNADFHYQTELPDLSYRSSTIVRSNPLMSYTGNPSLSSYRRYNFGVSYQWLPDNRFSFYVFGNGFLVSNRFAYVYEASADGVLRTVRQPMGDFLQGSYGVNCTVRLLDGNLQISGQVAQNIVKSGKPYDWTKSYVNWYLQAFYYLNQWHFGAQYQSDMSYADGFVNGIWCRNKNAYTAIIGWGNSTWSIQAQIVNPFRWNWRSGTAVMKSQNYDYVQTIYNPNNHCYVYVSATYTFGFGKKIQVGNDATQMKGAGSAILK